MKTINKFMMVIVAVMMVIGFSAFKMVEKSKSRQTDWYEVGPHPSIPNELEVKGVFSGTPIIGSDEDECATENLGDECAIYIILSPNAEDPTGKTLSELQMDPEVTLGEFLFQPENN